MLVIWGGQNRGDLIRMRTEPTYKGMTPPSTQKFKALGLWVFFLICCSTFSFLLNVRLRLSLEYLTISPSSESPSSTTLIHSLSSGSILKPEYITHDTLTCTAIHTLIRDTLAWNLHQEVLILVRSPRFCPLGLPTSGIRAIGLRLGRVQFDLVSKVFLIVISGKRVLYKCVNGGTSEGSWVMYSGLRIASARGRVYQCGGGVTLTWGRDC